MLDPTRYSYVVTRSRPYQARRSREGLADSGLERQRVSGCDVIASLPARRSREVLAVSGWRLGTAKRQLGQHPVLPLPHGGEGEVGGEPRPGGGGDKARDGEGEEERWEAEEDDPEGAEGMNA